MAIDIWPAILSPPHVKFLAWGTSSSLPTPMSSHGRAAMAMAMSLATFYRAWPYFFGGLYLHAMSYQSAGGPAPPLTLHFWPGGTSPPPRPRVVMAGPPWPWP